MENVVLDFSYYPSLFYTTIFVGFCWYALHMLMKDALGTNLKEGLKIIFYVFCAALLAITAFLAIRIESDPVDIGAVKTAAESREYIPPTEKEIKQFNERALIEEEIAIDKRMEEEKRKSKEAYEKALKEASDD